MAEVTIGIKVCDERLYPVYATAQAAGADLKANLENSITLEAGATCLVPTGVFLEIPEGYEVQIRPRSGLAAKSGLTVLNAPGTIDSDYRGEIKVILINHTKNAFVIEPYMRIAQMVVAKVDRALFVSLDALATSVRGEGGFGSSGLK